MNDHVTTWALRSLDKDIQLFEDMLEHIHKPADRARIGKEIARLKRLRAELEPEQGEFDTQPIEPIYPDWDERVQ